MKSIRSMTIWEIKHRLELLNEYKDLAELFYSNALNRTSRVDLLDWKEVYSLKTKLNEMLCDAEEYVAITGIPVVLLDTRLGKVAIFENMMRYDILPECPGWILDSLERAIGVYKSESPRAHKRTLNPLFWLVLILETLTRTIARILFPLIGIADRLIALVKKG